MNAPIQKLAEDLRNNVLSRESRNYLQEALKEGALPGGSATARVQGSPVWDQVLAFGEYQHVTVDGEPVLTVFDASKCRFMLDDFAVRKNDLFVDKRHEVVDAVTDDGQPLDLDEMQEWAEDGRALAWADALCMVVAGQVVKYVRHASAPESPPVLEELQRPDGNLPEDGVYARRFVVTPLGADPKEGLSVYRYTSPYFVPMRDGWRLLNYTATNDPRMEGVALGQAMRASGQVRMGRIAMSRARKAENMPAEDKAPDQHAAVMKAAGIAEDDAPDVKMNKMAAYAAKCEAERRKADDDAAAMKRKMEQESRKAEDKAEAMGIAHTCSVCGEHVNDEGFCPKHPDAEVDSIQTAARKADEDAKPPAGKASRKAEDHKEPDGDEGKAAMSRRMQALEEKNAMLEKELREGRSAMESFKKFEQNEKERLAKQFAASAIAMGRIRGDHKGSVAETEKWLAAKHLKSAADAEDLLSAEGTFQVSERLAMTRYTSGGAGINQPMPREDELYPANSVKALDEQIDRAIAMECRKLRQAGKSATYDAALAEIKRTNRKLYDAYNGRSN